MTRSQAAWWAVLAGLVALAACTHARSTAPASPSATQVPTATAGATPTATASIAAPLPGGAGTSTGTGTPKSAPTPARPLTSATPTAPAAPAGTPGGVALVITQADSGKTFTLAPGSVAELRLGANLRWSTPRATPPIVAIAQEPVASGAGYQAWRVTTAGHGTALVEATGAPVCQPGQVCAQYVILFRATIVVP